MNVKLMKFDINNIIKSENEYKKQEIKKSQLNLIPYLFLVAFCLIFLLTVPFFVDDILARKLFDCRLIDEFVLSICYIVVLCMEFKNLWEAIKIIRKIHVIKKELETLKSNDKKKVFDFIFKSEKQKDKSNFIFCLLYNPDKILSLKFVHTGTTNLEMVYVDDMSVVHTNILIINKKVIRTDISDIIIDLYNEVVYFPYLIEYPSIVDIDPQFIYEFQRDMFEFDKH